MLNQLTEVHFFDRFIALNWVGLIGFRQLYCFCLNRRQVPSMDLSDFCTDNLWFMQPSVIHGVWLFVSLVHRITSNITIFFQQNFYQNQSRISRLCHAGSLLQKTAAKECSELMGGGFSGCRDDQSRTPVALLWQLGQRRHGEIAKFGLKNSLSVQVFNLFSRKECANREQFVCVYGHKQAKQTFMHPVHLVSRTIQLHSKAKKGTEHCAN